MWIDRRSLLVGVAASVLLNALLVGVVLGHLVAASRRAEPRHGGPAGLHLEALPSDARTRFGAAMAAHRPAIRAARDASRGRRQAAEADIAAPAFDRDKVAADFAALRRGNEGVSAAVHAALLDALADLSPASRAALVARDR